MRFEPCRRCSILLMALVLLGCERDPRGLDGGRKVEVGRVPAVAQRPGDPATGYDALLNRPLLGCGLPYELYVRVAGTPPEPAVGSSLPGRKGRNAELPYMLTAYVADSGVELVTSNCLGCHAAPINGALVIGLGNEFLDMTVDPLSALEKASALVDDGPGAFEWHHWADRVTRVAEFMMTDTIGVNSAGNVTRALMAHRDPRTLAWSDRALIEAPPERPLPVSVPPWWTVRKKHALFYNAEGRGDHVGHLMLASLLCAESTEQVETLDPWFVDLRAYLGTLVSPDYPYSIDSALAAQGHRVFQGACKSCHGTYGEDWRYPNRVVSLGAVGTDPELARARFSHADRFLDWFRLSVYGRHAQVTPALGYIAPPLDGVWATAPYLHNGSVPTLAALLDSSSRPIFWEYDWRGEARPVYDQDGLGWSYRTLEHSKAGAMSWDERNRIYDTTLNGYGRQGHTFGDALEDWERAALIEYLKTL